MSVFPFDPDDPGDDGGPQFDPDAATAQLKQVRDWGKSLERKVKAQEKDLKELEELREFKKGYEAEVKATEASKIFERLGLPPAQAKLFVREAAEVSEDAVRKFAADYGLAASEVKTDAPGTGAPPEPSAGAPRPEGFRPVAGQPGEGFVDGATFSQEDIETLLARGQSEQAADLIKKGRVKLNKLSEEYGYIK